MSMIMIINRSLFLLLIIEMSSYISNAKTIQAKVFDVTKYGAIADARTDNTKVHKPSVSLFSLQISENILHICYLFLQAFLSAWSDACKWNGKSRVLVPKGTFLLNSITFSGPCKRPIAFTLVGTLQAPTNHFSMENGQWISFRYITGLAVNGGGVLNGEGASSWKYAKTTEYLPIVSSIFPSLICCYYF